jgi:hypothetical protein
MLKLGLNAYFHNSFITMPYEITKVGNVHHYYRKQFEGQFFREKGFKALHTGTKKINFN